MNGFSSSEVLFYSGIALMILAAAGGLVSGVALRISGRRLRRKLEEEFGEKRR